MKLSDHIKKHHNGTQRHFATFYGIPASRVNEMIKSKREHVVLEYENEAGEKVTSVFRECRELSRK